MSLFREAGDSALLIDVASIEAGAAGALDAAVHARAVAIAESCRQQQVHGVRDVVPTFASVAVFFDPRITNVASVEKAVQASLPGNSGTLSGRVVEVPVSYGGDAGPDLAAVAAFGKCAPEEVVRRHASRTYRVFMVGFLPGFPYLAEVDESIAAPRRDTPRLRVPAGSVGIAGRQTGIYPRESPGGWQIIGRTNLRLFDVDSDPPALLMPGDSVRFVPVAALEESGDDASSIRDRGAEATITGAEHSGWITVLNAGLLTTVQDPGRWGFQHLGVPVSGPMDPVSHRMANTLVGNPSHAATLEATLVGPELRFERAARIAVAGADLQPVVDGQPLAAGSARECRAGSVLRFGPRRSGARAYIAVDGGIATRAVLGSRATHVASQMGGLDGRALRAGERLPLGRMQPEGDETAPRAPLSEAPPHGVTWPANGGARVRILPGPQADRFDRSAFDLLQRGRYLVTPHSDRMGYRLAGPAIPVRAAAEMVSDVTFIGGLQVPPSGQPILLMADRQTSGGYPQMAIVITADLPRAGQLAPGDWIEFELTSHEAAAHALMEQDGLFR